jgi:hypothetical protein
MALIFHPRAAVPRVSGFAPHSCLTQQCDAAPTSSNARDAACASASPRRGGRTTHDRWSWTVKDNWMTPSNISWDEILRIIALRVGISDQAIEEFPWLQRWMQRHRAHLQRSEFKMAWYWYD